MSAKLSSDLFINRKDVVILKSRKRLICLSAPFALFYLIIILRLLTLTVSYEENISIEIENDKKNRPIILDRNGIILATTLTTYSVYANPNKIIDQDSTAKKILNVLDALSYSNILQSFNTKRNFSWIKRHITPKELVSLKALGIPGIGFEKDERRVYPQGNLFAHVIGYTDIDGNGLSGFEKSINNTEKDYIQLSLDLRIQNVVHKELKNAVEKFTAVGGAGIVLDVRTGEILAMVSIPDFDLNNQSQANNSQRFNRTSLGIYEMGSIFKIFTIASALDTETTTLDETFNVIDPINISQFTINDFYKFDKPYLTVQEIFAKSSNVGIAKIALKLGYKLQSEYLEKFNILSPLDIEIPEKSYPIIPKRWNNLTSTTISYGYGIAITPIHVVQATASLVNGGIMNSATLFLQNETHDENSTIEERRVIKKSTSEMICKLLRIAVKKGSGKKADAHGYLVGGKTGSAEKVIKGKYSKDSNISSFIGVFPITKPKYVVFILIDEPHGNKTVGGIVAAPVVKNIINKIAPILNIPPEKTI